MRKFVSVVGIPTACKPIPPYFLPSQLNERATSADVRELFNVAGCVMGVQYDRTRGTAVVGG